MLWAVLTSKMTGSSVPSVSAFSCWSARHARVDRAIAFGRVSDARCASSYPEDVFGCPTAKAGCSRMPSSAEERQRRARWGGFGEIQAVAPIMGIDHSDGRFRRTNENAATAFATVTDRDALLIRAGKPYAPRLAQQCVACGFGSNPPPVRANGAT